MNELTRHPAAASVPANVSDHSINSESQDGGLDTCLKCGKTIAHIPYKYNGQTFHARCLVCNHCGRNLVGKPFITEINQIFCGDQCKQNFAQNPCTVASTTTSQVSESNDDTDGLDQSLMDALESIKESKRDILHLNRQPSPLQNVLDADRITDYPRRTSPSTSLLSLSSRRSSLSAVSQSSFTSDSSFENGRRPGKKILKNPLQPPRRSKNRVRWKLPNNSSDSLSVDSFESVGSNIYDRARSGVVMATQNWREFEQSPPRGSTGITPMKPPLSKMRTSLSTGTLQTHQYTSPYRGLTTIPQGAVISSLGVKSNETPSPLTYNTSSNNSVSPGGVLSSTPLRHTQSTSAIDFHKQMQLRRGSPNVAGVPILRLDSSNLTDLEESTLEDRKRMHIYQFPQTRSPGTTLQSPDTSRSKPSSQSLTAALLDDDDANDYDHLSPLRGNKGGTDQPSGNKVITSLLHGNKVGTGHPSLLHGNKVGTGHPSLLHGNKVGTGHPSLLHGNKVSTDHPSLLHGNKVRTQEQQKKDDTDIYSNQDIDDALEVIAKESSGGSTGSHGSSPAEELPPTLPPKKFHRGRNVTIGLESSGNSTSVQPTPGTSSALSFQTQRQSFAHSVTSPQSSSARHASSRSPQVPPPVPPKTRRRKQETNAPTSSHSAQIPYLQKQQQENHKTPENTSRSPSFGERQAAVIKTSPSQSQGSAEEDLMSGVSSTTLVDQEDATTSKSSKSSTTHAPSEYHKQPWSVPGLKERVVVGAEDPGPPIDKLIRTSTDQFPTMTAWNFTSHDPRQPTQHDRQQKFHDPTLSFSVSHSQPDPGSMDFMMPYPTYNQQQVHSQQVRRAPEDKLTVAPTTKRYKLSLDNAFTEGNIMQPVQLSQPVRSTGERSARNQSTHRAQQRGIPRSNSVGQTSRMPTSADIKWSPEEAQVRQRFYSGGKLPMEKPVHHVKDQSVAQLLKDLNINDTGRAGTITCKVCNKSIQGSSYTMHGENYHSRCYRCTICGSMLRGKKSFPVNNKLLCKDCHARKQRSPGTNRDSSEQHYRRNLHPSRDIQQTSALTKHNMTSV